jgi:uncharacterized membrane protein YraQ (UPF0718 family)
MAPYLLFGFAMAGALSAVFTPAFVERHLGRRGAWQVIKASLLGVPLPLCSCSVVPVAASLRRHGASRGATLSFLASTPQTGIDSIMVTHALMGPVLTVIRVVAAAVSGVAAGLLMEAVEPRNGAPAPEEPRDCACCAHRERPRWLRMLRYAFVTLPWDIGRSMLLGILLSAVLSALIPDDYFADALRPGILSMLAMMAVGIPLYVCSSGSVPIALALVRMGVSPGAALVFLITGPATNAATVVTVWKILGKAATAVYLGTIAGVALVAGWALDRFPAALPMQSANPHCHPDEPATWVGHALAALLLVMLAPSLLPERWRDRLLGERPADPVNDAASNDRTSA